MKRATPEEIRPIDGRPATRMVNAMTVDVEDYFQVSALAPYVARDQWASIACRIPRNVDRILALFDAAGVRATFFTLGWVAERHPAVVRAIVAAGHELASHGYGHERVGDLDRDRFEQDLRRAKGLLEDAGGVAVTGYRAPSFSIDGRTPWAHQTLAETGHRYSSSVFPIAHDHYGMPDAPRFPYRQDGGVVEIPPTSIRLLGRNLPAAGGGWFRLLPYPVSRWSMRRVNAHDRQPGMFYFHPWEIDPEQPRYPQADARTRFRHYLNLGRTHARLERLLRDFAWDRVDRVFASHLGA